MPAEAKVLAMTSFNAWWRWVRPEARLQTKACWPQASTYYYYYYYYYYY